MIGNYGSGTFAQNGGTNSTQSLVLANSPGSSGSYSLGGSGRLLAPTEYVGYAATGMFTQSGGSKTMTGFLILGNNPSSSGTYTLTSSGSLRRSSAPWEYVGLSGSGSFIQSAGTNTATSALYVGNASNASGTYTLYAGQLNGSTESIGNAQNSPSIFQQYAGNNAISSSLVLGSNAGSNGYYHLAGGSLSAPTEYIGSSGTGTFEQQLGMHAVPSTLYVGYNPGSSGTYYLFNRNQYGRRLGRRKQRRQQWSVCPGGRISFLQQRRGHRQLRQRQLRADGWDPCGF